MSIEWILTEDKYEVSTKNHLLQIMSKGTRFTETGTPPSDYWSSDYIQTADIDLESDSMINPIGSSTEPFGGSYDGNHFAITDWTYSSNSEDNTGLFGYISTALIQNISLEGTWVLSCASNSGST